MARLFAFLLVFCSLLGSARADFASAVASYDAGKYTEALTEFTELSKTGLSAELAYNLGCTESKLGRPGAAALWFYRASLLDPMHREALQNIRYLKKREGILTFDNGALADFSKFFRPSLLQAVMIGSAWIFVISLAVLLFLRPKVMWPWVIALVVVVSIGITATVAWIVRNQQHKPEQISVMVEASVNALNAPATMADEVIPVTPGTQVKPLEERGDWTYIEMPVETSTRGWVPTASLKPLWPFDPKLIE